MVAVRHTLHKKRRKIGSATVLPDGMEGLKVAPIKVQHARTDAQIDLDILLTCLR